jgi:drug/metabolite transporter (DMT)-like permease
MQTTPSNGYLKWILIGSLALVWGSSFMLMKRALVNFAPDQMAAIRMFASFLFLVPFTFTRFKEVQPQQWKYIAASGFLGNGIPAFLFAFAQTKVPSFMAGMLNSLTPVFTLALSFFIFNIKVKGMRLLGVLIGLAGAIGLIIHNANGSVFQISWHAILIIVATLCYAGSVNVIRYKLHDAGALTVSSFALCFVGPISGVYLFGFTDFLHHLQFDQQFFTGSFFNIFSTNPINTFESLISVLILALFGTAISVVVFNQLIKIAGSLFASSVTYLIPIVAMLWGVVFGEPLVPIHLLFLAAILVGVYLINRSK